MEQLRFKLSSEVRKLVALIALIGLTSSYLVSNRIKDVDYLELAMRALRVEKTPDVEGTDWYKRALEYERDEFLTEFSISGTKIPITEKKGDIPNNSDYLNRPVGKGSVFLESPLSNGIDRNCFSYAISEILHMYFEQEGIEDTPNNLGWIHVYQDSNYFEQFVELGILEEKLVYKVDEDLINEFISTFNSMENTTNIRYELYERINNELLPQLEEGDILLFNSHFETIDDFPNSSDFKVEPNDFFPTHAAVVQTDVLGNLVIVEDLGKFDVVVSNYIMHPLSLSAQFASMGEIIVYKVSP